MSSKRKQQHDGYEREDFDELKIRRTRIVAPSSSSITLTLPSSTGTLLGSGDRLLIPAGTLASPAIAFSADTDTGMYRSGADTIDFAVNAVRKCSITSTNLQVVHGGLLITGNSGTYTPTTTSGAAITSGQTNILDTTSSGTVAQHYSHYFGRKTLNCQNTTTYTTAYGVWLDAPPLAGTNATITTRHTLGMPWGSIINLGSSTGTGTTNQIIFPLGTAALPSYTFLNDTNTGIYSSAADNVDISTGGTARVNISNSGIKIGSTGTAHSCRTHGSTNITPPGIFNWVQLTINHGLGAIPTFANAIVHKNNVSNLETYAVQIDSWSSTTITFRVTRTDTNAIWADTYVLFWEAIL